MASTCSICAARADRGAIEALVETGGDLVAVKKLLSDRGIEATTYAIKKHLRDHTRIEIKDIHESLITKVQPTQAERQKMAAEKASRKREVAEYLDSVAAIDVESVLAQMGVNTRPDTMGDVLTLIQRMSIATHTVASAIAYTQLQRFARDPEGRHYPQLEMRGVQATSQMVSEAFGTAQAASLQSAADLLERSGYKVIEAGSEESPAT